MCKLIDVLCCMPVVNEDTRRHVDMSSNFAAWLVSLQRRRIARNVLFCVGALMRPLTSVSSLTSSFRSLHFPSPLLPRNATRASGARCKLPQRGSGRSPGRKRILALKTHLIATFCRLCTMRMAVKCDLEVDIRLRTKPIRFGFLRSANLGFLGGYCPL